MLYYQIQHNGVGILDIMEVTFHFHNKPMMVLSCKLMMFSKHVVAIKVYVTRANAKQMNCHACPLVDLKENAPSEQFSDGIVC